MAIGAVTLSVQLFHRTLNILACLAPLRVRHTPGPAAIVMRLKKIKDIFFRGRSEGSSRINASAVAAINSRFIVLSLMPPA